MPAARFNKTCYDSFNFSIRNISDLDLIKNTSLIYKERNVKQKRSLFKCISSVANKFMSEIKLKAQKVKRNGLCEKNYKG